MHSNMHNDISLVVVPCVRFLSDYKAYTPTISVIGSSGRKQ